MKNLTYEQKVQTLEYSYNHAQDTARFMDKKVTAVIAATSTLATLNLSTCKWAFSLIDEKTWSIWPCWLVFVLGIVAFVLFGYLFTFIYLAIRHSFKALEPGKPKDSFDSVIFPYIKAGEEDGDFVKRIEEYLAEVPENSAIEDYTKQLKEMGRINGFKIKESKIAIKAVPHVIWATLLLGIYAVGIMFSFGF